MQSILAAKGRLITDLTIPSLGLQHGKSYATTVNFVPVESVDSSCGFGPLPILIYPGNRDVVYPDDMDMRREMGSLLRETRVPRVTKAADLEELLSTESDWPVITLGMPLQWPVPDSPGKSITLTIFIFKVV